MLYIGCTDLQLSDRGYLDKTERRYGTGQSWGVPTHKRERVAVRRRRDWSHVEKEDTAVFARSELVNFEPKPRSHPPATLTTIYNDRASTWISENLWRNHSKS